MGLNYGNVYTTDATPTPERVGDLWITSTAVRICSQVTPPVWTYLSGGGARVGSLTQTVTRAEFTDGGGAAGTFVMTGVVPAGAILLPTSILVPLGFTGDTSAVIIVGDGSDTDRYMTGTPSVFTTAPTGIDAGIVSGLKRIVTANSPTLTITSGADFTNVTAGSVTVSINYLLPG